MHQLALNGAVALVHGDVVASDKALGKYVDVMKPIILVRKGSPPLRLPVDIFDLGRKPG